MTKKLLVLSIVAATFGITGCANTEPSEAEREAKVANKKTLIEAAVQPGKDSRCLSLLGFEACYQRERTVVQ